MFKEPEGQVARWLECLQEFSFDIQHCKGKLHGNADPLSRYPEIVKDDEQDLATLSAVNAEPLLAAVSVLPVLLECSPAEIWKLQLDDDVLGPIAVAVETKQKPNISQQKSRAYGLLLQQWDRLYVQDGLLFRDYQDTKGNHKWAQLLVPKALQEEVVSSLHGGVASGHLGDEKTISRIRERFYWPGFSQHARDWCRSCYTCAARKTPTPHGRGELQSIVPGYPLQIVAVDIMGPLPETPMHNRYVLVATDYFTRWTEACAIPNL